MTGPGRTRERLVALFLMGALAFTPPLLAIFNTPARLFGIPVLYLYLFALWAGLILLVALAIERAGKADARSTPGPEAAATPRSPPAEPHDA